MLTVPGMLAMPTTCLVTYDITSPKRLRRMHRALKKVAVPIQYSVFLGLFTSAGLVALRACISDIIDPARDDVRIYPLPRNCWQRRLGRPQLPQGVVLTMLPQGIGETANEGLARPDERPAPCASAACPVRGRSARGHVRRARTGQHRGIMLIR